MHSRQAQISDALSDYTNIRTIPAILSVAFIVASLYQFQGISQVMLPWFDYTLTGNHATLVSLGSFAVAFASSETRQFENYEDWEQAAILLGPVVILGYQYVNSIKDIILGLGDPIGLQIAFAATIVSWGVAVR
jgi:hypothetical protein